jgi:hypothetical protein
MIRVLRSSVAAGLVLFGIAGPLRANLIMDGGFESPDTPTFQAVNAGDPAIAPWVVGLVGVDVVDVNNGFVAGPAFEGTQYLDLDGTPGPGQITQAFATTPGLTYTLLFAYANNFNAQASASAFVRVFDSSGDRLGPQSFTHSTSASGNLDWTVLSQTFVAVEASTSLQFTSQSPGGNGGILLDGISITEAVPEPASLALFGIGGLGLLAYRRRLRRVAA